MRLLDGQSFLVPLLECLFADPGSGTLLTVFACKEVSVDDSKVVSGYGFVFIYYCMICITFILTSGAIVLQLYRV